MFWNNDYVERQAKIMERDLARLEQIMYAIGQDDSNPPDCMVCAKCGSVKANNFWSPATHIQSKVHLKCAPSVLPKGDDVDHWWQTFTHEGRRVHFNHCTFELRVEWLRP